MTLGLPLIASDMPCNREALAGGQRGILTHPGDPAALAQAILDVLATGGNPDLIAAGLAHTSEAARHLDCDVIAEELHHRYQDLISARTAPTRSPALAGAAVSDHHRMTVLPAEVVKGTQ